jgi:hypothetical protein
MLSGEKYFQWTRARFVIALVALFAFSFQSYLVQTHIHGASGSEITSQTPEHHKAPLDKDSPDDCPICQAFALAGAFVSPVVVFLGVALLFVEVQPTLILSGASGPLIRRNWRSRAPPRI